MRILEDSYPADYDNLLSVQNRPVTTPLIRLKRIITNVVIIDVGMKIRDQEVMF